MPTVHVAPGADAFLQEIANALHKAKKVVVVTGAGISTNSGIPDFRSENGLYSLIQAQFDAASRELEKRDDERRQEELAEEQKQAEEHGMRSSHRLVEDVEERPTKRRKVSIQDDIVVESQPDAAAERGTISQDERQQSPKAPQAPLEIQDQPMTQDSGDCITVEQMQGTPARDASAIPHEDEPVTDDEVDFITLPQGQPTPGAEQSNGKEEDQTTACDEDNSMTTDDSLCITVDDGMTITVAGGNEPDTEGDSLVSVVEESIVVLGGAGVEGSPSASASGSGSAPAPGSPSENQGGADGGVAEEVAVTRTEHGARGSALTGVPPGTANGSPALPARQPQDGLIIDSQPALGPISVSGPLENPSSLSSSPRASTPRRSHLSSDIDQKATNLCSSSPLSSPPPISSDFYESSSLERTYSRSESPSAEASSDLSSLESSELSSSSEEESSGTSTPYLTSQTSSNSSQSRTTTLPNLKGRDLFDASIWADPIKTSVFYTFATTLRQKARDVSPTASHLFLSVLRDQRKLVRCYTQNIDRLEDRIGLSTSLELGAGSRYRFSAKAWRNSGANGREGQGQGQGPGQKDEPGVQEGEGAGSAAAAGAAEEAESNYAAERAGGGAPEATGQEGVQGPCVPGGRPRTSLHPHHLHPQRPPVPPPPPAAAAQPGQGQGQGSARPPGPKGQVKVPQGQTPDEPDPGGGLGERPVGSSPAPSGSVLSAAASASNPATASLSSSSSRPTPSPSATAPPLPSSQPTSLSTPNRGVECVFLHGSLELLRCFLCGLTSSWDELDRELETLAGRQPTCPHCAGATAAREERGKRALGVGKLRPDIVLYGEEHPQSEMIGNIVQHDLSLGPDMLIVMGTSLRVHGLKTVVREFARAVHAKGGKVVFVNYTKPPDSVWSDVIDFWVQSDCDAWVEDVKSRKPGLWKPGCEEDEGKGTKGKRGSITAGGLRRTVSGLSVGSEKEAKSGKNASAGLRRTSSALSIGENQAPASIAKAKRKSTGGAARLRRKESNLSLVEAVPKSPSSPEEDTKPEPEPEPAALKVKVVPKETRRSLPTGGREAKLDPNAKRPQCTREDHCNGAYLVWKIREDLKRLTGQPKLSLRYSLPAPPPAPKAPRSRKPRQSAPAVLDSEPMPLVTAPPPDQHQSQSTDEQGLPSLRPPPHLRPRLLPFDPITHSSPILFAQQLRPPVIPSPSQPFHSLPATPFFSLPPGTPSLAAPLPFQIPHIASEVKENTPQYPASQPKPKRGRTTKPRAKKVSNPLPLPFKPDPTPIPPSSAPPPTISPTSISAAIKSNPRVRKRKIMDDGVAATLPTVRPVKARPSFPATTPSTTRTPPLQTQSSPPLLRTPSSGHIILPQPRPSLTPNTPRFEVRCELDRFRAGSHSPLELPGLTNPPPDNGGGLPMATFEPRPLLGPGLPEHNWPGEFFVVPSTGRAGMPVRHTPFWMEDPGAAWEYRRVGGVEWREGGNGNGDESPELSPSDQLRSEGEAALGMTSIC